MKNASSAVFTVIFVILLVLWELMHQWLFWVVVMGIAGVVWLYRYQKPSPRSEHFERVAEAPKWMPPVSSKQVEQKSSASPIPDLKDYMPHVFVNDQGMLSMNLPDDASLPPPTGDAQFDALQRTRILDQWDAARRKLQQISYGMVSETPEAKASFTKFMKVFAERDPLLSSVLGTLMPIIRSNPGVLQTALYKHVPGVEVEEVRYVLYFAEQLQLVRREKKGNTYRLLPIGEVIDVAST